jgi:propionyl-CoA carboxylase alpha chain
MFSKILIANRGEIACRIIKTARRMGIATVAVYSDADKRALHVRMADHAVHIGPAPAGQSYLAIDNILDACRRSGAQAVHPGYGSLSERAAFAEALEAAGIAFIGPNPGAIKAMGDKIASKKFANAAEVSTIPGYLGAIEDVPQAVRIAGDIGYPVMIKASAGGGGKGMRVAYSAAEVEEGFVRARSEAASSFGDDRVFIEKFIENPRHIEIQILGDKHGNLVYLGERECSIQRRNQKVIEEAPSPSLDEATRRKMGEQAVALARAVNYDSAGTVEFVAGQDRSFYFLEMNTRLQVEHPVTEFITGIDLVEQMIRVAAGDRLAFGQEDVKLKGWAVESRIYAEDPVKNFMPSTGRLTVYQPPLECPFDGAAIRNDAGVEEGGDISIHYDPMIAKLVTHAPTREQAIEAQAFALDAFAIDGIRHNIPFLSALMHHPRWQAGTLSTGFIAEEFPGGFALSAPAGGMARTMAAVAAAMHVLLDQRKERVRRACAAAPQARSQRVVLLDAERFEVSVEPAAGSFLVRFHGADGALHTLVSDWRPGQPAWTGTDNGIPIAVQVRPILNGFLLSRGGRQARARVLTRGQAELVAFMPSTHQATAEAQLRSPMASVIRSIAVKAGQEIKAGDPLCTIEAMKMEHTLYADQVGAIAKIHVKEGDLMVADGLIMEFS